MKRPTVIQVRNFAKKNADRLFLKVKRTFNGMADGFDDERAHDFKLVDHVRCSAHDYYDHFKDEWKTFIDSTISINDTYHLCSVKGGNWYRHYEDEEFIGYEVNSHAFYTVIAIKK